MSSYLLVSSFLDLSEQLDEQMYKTGKENMQRSRKRAVSLLHYNMGSVGLLSWSSTLRQNFQCS
jgi:hypothetical protein